MSYVACCKNDGFCSHQVAVGTTWVRIMAAATAVDHSETQAATNPRDQDPMEVSTPRPRVSSKSFYIFALFVLSLLHCMHYLGN